MSNIIKDYKSGMPKVHGRTTINHEARMELMINCSEYVFLDWVYREISKGKEPDIAECYIKTGFNSEQQQMLIQRLIKKGFMYPGKEDSINLTPKWESSFADLDMEFESYFWKKSGKVCWTGSKGKAKTLYIKLRKSTSRDLILKQRNMYFKLLEIDTWRQKMMATVFLGPDQRWKDEWEDQLQEARKKQIEADEEYKKRENVQPLTEEQLKGMYGKDNS